MVTHKSIGIRLVLFSSCLLLAILGLKGTFSCKQYWKIDDSYYSTTNSTCKKQFLYLPQLNGVYCFNNGTGICKAFAGQFEFYFNTFQDKFLYPAPKSEFVDDHGYHKRIPVSYNIDGQINYVDKSINWAKGFKSFTKSEKLSLLSTKDFNWCGYTGRNLWPYKSSIVDYKSNGRFNIYFYNRQSCILDKNSGSPPQHFNTRFLAKSNLRIDLDYNPTIFAMEDDKAKEIRLVKHKRQHWYEVSYSVVEKPTGDIKYFVDMEDTEKWPLRVGGDNSVVLTVNAFKNVSKLCLDNSLSKRAKAGKGDSKGKNNPLFQHWCGADEVEISDWPWPYFKKGRSELLEADLHNLPRHPKSNELFYGLKISSEEDWEQFAKDGFVFSAMTTIPIIKPGSSDLYDETKVRVLMLYSFFQNSNSKSKYDEYYPTPYLADYEASWDGKDSWNIGDRKQKSKELKNLNYVDDIAYLHKCGTVLIIFGPLYSELPMDKFSIDTKAPIDSIDKLSIYEIANAFFAEPDKNILWVYHRTNWVAAYSYTCASGPDKLVTATKAEGGKYFFRHGEHQPAMKAFEKDPTSNDYSEETLFSALQLFKGTISPEAPDPAQYPLGADAPEQPVDDSSNTLLYIVIGIGVLIIVAMCIACLLTLRRRKRKRMRDELTRRSSALPGSRLSSSTTPSKRSSFISPSGIQKPVSAGSATSARSSLHSGGSPGSHHTPSTRSSLRSASAGSKASSKAGIPSTRSNLRSGASSHGPKTARSSMAGSHSSKHSRSGSKHASPSGSKHASHSGSEHASPSGSEHASPSGSKHASHSGSEHASHSGSKHASPSSKSSASRTATPRSSG